MIYPLYDYLLDKINTRKDKNIDIRSICVTINDMAINLTSDEFSTHYTEIAALILHHDILVNKVLLTSAAYEGKVMAGGKGILYNITNLPPLLQQIIAQYIEESKS